MTVIRRADSISDQMIREHRTVTLPADPPVTGRLDAVLAVGDRYTFVLIADGRRAIYQLPAGALVEIHREAP